MCLVIPEFTIHFILFLSLTYIFQYNTYYAYRTAIIKLDDPTVTEVCYCDDDKARQFITSQKYLCYSGNRWKSYPYIPFDYLVTGLQGHGQTEEQKDTGNADLQFNKDDFKK